MPHPWRPVEAEAVGEGRYRGPYRADMARDVGDLAPHRPRLHALPSPTIACTDGHHPAAAAPPGVEPAESRRRSLPTGLRLSLQEPVHESPVPVVLPLGKVTHKGRSHRLLLVTGSPEVADGKHAAEAEGCVNFRDTVDA